MTFGPNHYVPVLKVKRGEKQALSLVPFDKRVEVTPLLEIVESKDRPLESHLATSFAGLSESLLGYSACFLDVHELAPDGPLGADRAFNRARREGIPFIPVTGISRTVDVAAALALRSTHGVALRVTRREFEEGRIPDGLHHFLAIHSAEPQEIDLIVDLGNLEEMIPEGVMNLTEDFLQCVPMKSQWKTLTLTGCAFPRSMGAVDRDSFAQVTRSEWIAWRDGLFLRRAAIERLPTFGDCAIQHPSGVEGFDFRFMSPSATIRYTQPDTWLLVKGVSARVERASIQFPQLASQIVYGHLHSRYAGDGHCAGCLMIRRSADGESGLGSAEVWRRIGTIHHIMAVISDDLASLPWP